MQENIKLSLAIIAKDEVEQLKRIINDYESYFDEIAIAIDSQFALEEIQKLNNPKVKLYKYEWCDDFAHKRNFLQSKITGDYYFRIDTDDAIENPQKIREVLEYAHKNDISVVACYYDYSRDEDGNTNAAHYRETIIKNTNNLFWNKPIHENILPKDISKYKFYIDETIKIKHLIDYEHSLRSLIRNLNYLIKEYNRDRENTDPRTLAYLGRTFFCLGDFDKAIFFLQKHIEKSGWDEDRYLSWCFLGEVFNHKNEFDTAIACFNEALQERPEFPDAYFKLHDIYFAKKQWQKAIIWGEMGFSKPIPKTLILLDPSSYTWRPALSMAYCYAQLDNWEKANKFFDYAKKLVPNLKWVKENEKYFKEGLEQFRFNEAFVKIISSVKKYAPEKIRDLLNAIPHPLDKSELISRLRVVYSEPKVWLDNEVCILCPPTPEIWSPKSVEKGIGGSEEAVIQLSKQLAKLGFKVVVYNTCGDEAGVYDGVEYKEWFTFNPKDKFSHLIGWRFNPAKFNIEAKNLVIWIHDIPHCLDNITDDEIKQINKIVVLSKYHKTLLPSNIPEGKVVISTNGLVPEDFEVIKEIERNPFRIIYASSYDRGLEIILKGWQEVKKEVPGAELHIFYGWHTFDKLLEQGLVDFKIKENLIKLMKQDGVFEHGRIGHKELLKEYAKSKIFAYPTIYKGEINCIALTKALACGCICLTNDRYVLPERNPHIVVKDEEFIPTLIKLLKDQIKVNPIDTQKYIQDNSWESVAKDWAERIITLDIPTEIEERLTWIRKQLENDKDKKIVDIGSNKGHLFAGWDRTNITSVDLDVYDLPNFVRANAEDLPFADKGFDVAVLGEVLEHCQNPIKALKEAKRVAKKVIITVPYEHEWTLDKRPFNKIEDTMKLENKSKEEIAKNANPAKEFYTEDNLDHLWHHRYYTPQLLEEHLQEAGFSDYKIIKIKYEGWAWLGVIYEDRSDNSLLSSDKVFKGGAEELCVGR